MVCKVVKLVPVVYVEVVGDVRGGARVRGPCMAKRKKALINNVSRCMILQIIILYNIIVSFQPR